MPFNNDQNTKKRELLIQSALDIVRNGQDKNDLKLKIYYAIISYGLLLRAKEEELFDADNQLNISKDVNTFENFKSEALDTVAAFLRRHIK